MSAIHAQSYDPLVEALPEGETRFVRRVRDLIGKTAQATLSPAQLLEGMAFAPAPMSVVAGWPDATILAACR